MRDDTIEKHLPLLFVLLMDEAWDLNSTSDV